MLKLKVKKYKDIIEIIYGKNEVNAKISSYIIQY